MTDNARLAQIKEYEGARNKASDRITELSKMITEEERKMAWCTKSIYNLTPQTLSLSDIERKLGHKVIIREGL